MSRLIPSVPFDVETGAVREPWGNRSTAPAPVLRGCTKPRLIDTESGLRAGREITRV
jgi:hypothetical protein